MPAPGPKSKERYLGRSRWRGLGFSRWTRRLILLTILICGLGYFIRGLSDLRDQSIKRIPTDFTSLRTEDSHFWRPPQPIRKKHSNLIDDRYMYLRQLAAGQQGSVAVYFDLELSHTVAMKTFTTAATNVLDDRLVYDYLNYTTVWPTEIEAGLLLSADDSFVTLSDYFILLDGDEWTWAKVEPFMSHGTLQTLAHEESTKPRLTIDALDKEYRPMLVKLLTALQPLHKADICHDDIKPDNIFIQSRHKWLIGDLGGVRHADHPFHRTLSWSRQNQLKDCRLNDVRRVLKTYLWFLRLSTGANVAAFDRLFWQKNAAWSRIYWGWVENPVSLEETIANLPPVEKGESPVQTVVACPCETETALAEATERELICTSIPRRLWGAVRRWAPTW